MVRFKARLMLVQVRFVDGANVDPKTGKVNWFPSREDLLKELRNTIQGCFGIAASDAMMELQSAFE